MKFMSYKCFSYQTEKYKKWLTDEVGVTVFKVVPDHRGMLDAAGEPVEDIIIFFVDDEHATAIRLKYPTYLFQDHMA
jgi:hypothetical protein